MNKIILQGRLTKDPELKITETGIDVLNFSLGVKRTFKKQGAEAETDFLNCVAWQKTAKFIETYFKKGDGIVVVGRLESRKYIDRDGNNRTATEIVVEQVEFPLSRKTAATSDTDVGNSGWVPMDNTDDDLPF